MRDHDVTALTAGGLERARRELAASLALARPDSPVRAPILARITAIDTERMNHLLLPLRLTFAGRRELENSATDIQLVRSARTTSDRRSV